MLRRMNGPRTTALFLIMMTLGGLHEVVGQELRIGIVDFYGLGRVPESEARRALVTPLIEMARRGHTRGTDPR